MRYGRDLDAFPRHVTHVTHVLMGVRLLFGPVTVRRVWIVGVTSLPSLGEMAGLGAAAESVRWGSVHAGIGRVTPGAAPELGRP